MYYLCSRRLLMECDPSGLPHFAKLFQRQLVEVCPIEICVQSASGLYLGLKISRIQDTVIRLIALKNQKTLLSLILRGLIQTSF